MTPEEALHIRKEEKNSYSCPFRIHAPRESGNGVIKVLKENNH
jgi:hypothetical protein